MSTTLLPRRTMLLGLAAAPMALNAPLVAAATPAVPPLSVEARRILALEPRYAEAVAKSCRLCDSDPGHAEAEAVTQALDNEFKAICDVILGRPVTSLSDVVDRALMARWGADVNTDGSWGELQTGIYDSAAAETALSVLILAGLTDGTVEREGRPGYVAPPVEMPPHPYRAWVLNDANAPELRAGMSIEANPALAPRPGELVSVRPGLGPDCPFIGRYEEVGDRRCVVTTNADMPSQTVWLAPGHQVAVVEWVVRRFEERQARPTTERVVAGA